ncbi:MAG TPA: hypothetical protein PLZ52_01990 [Bacteroidales bacterium]|nr:hypothetical protein [Bacteroidales bacterium]HQL70053.1 hypothetical protein [Bacteroidales bacterium]
MKSRYKHILFGFIVAILLLTALIENTGFIHLRFEPLKGFASTYQRPRFTLKTWMSAEFQDSLGAYLDNNTVFRAPLIRMYNEVNYRLFSKSTAKTVVIGKNNQLFQTDYIREYNGEYFIGKELIRQRCERIKYIQDTLARAGIDLLVVLAPGKASFFHEFIPDRYQQNKHGNTNYRCFKQTCAELGINTLDLQACFMQMKDTASWPLYPTYGVHWSDYGMYLALDTFVNHISQLTGKKVPALTVSGIDKTHQPRGEDYDTGDLMNLMFPLNETTLAYPKFSNADTVTPEINALIVGDSYIFHWLKYGLGEYLFKDYRFWYYNVMVYPEYYTQELYNYNLNIKEEIMKRDIIVLECAETFMYTAFWNFEDMAYKLFNPAYKADGVFYYQNDITKDHDQFLEVYDAAVRKNKALAAELLNEAQLRESTAPLGSVEFYIYSIKSDEQWLALITRQAAEQGVPLEEAIRNNAIWMTENDEY